MMKFIGTWKNKTTGEFIEISGVYPGDYYLLKYDFSNGDYHKEDQIAINIGIPKEIDELEFFDIRYSKKFVYQQFFVCKDCLTIDNQEYIRIKN